MNNKSICYVLSYYSPKYIRTRTLITAIQESNKLELCEARNSSVSLIRYVETVVKLIWTRLVKNPDYYLLGFRGIEIFWLIRILTFGKPLIFDHMMSPYDSLINEKRIIKAGSVLDKILYSYEKISLQQADLILTDTPIHQKFFSNLYKVSSKKIIPIPVGADEESLRNKSMKDSSKVFEVLFYGSFLPLHGIDVILLAAENLRNLPIKLRLIGGDNKDSDNISNLVQQKKLYNVDHQQWLAFDDLLELAGSVSVGLGGPFGNTPQGNRVVTGKTMQFFALGKATIVGKIAEDYGFQDKINCLLVQQGDPVALANAIHWAYRNQNLLPEIGRAAKQFYKDNFSINVIRKELEKVLV